MNQVNQVNQVNTANQTGAPVDLASKFTALTPEVLAALRATPNTRYIYSALPKMYQVTYPDSHGSHVWADQQGRIFANTGIVVDSAYTGNRTKPLLLAALM